MQLVVLVVFCGFESEKILSRSSETGSSKFNILISDLDSLGDKNLVLFKFLVESWSVKLLLRLDDLSAS